MVFLHVLLSDRRGAVPVTVWYEHSPPRGSLTSLGRSSGRDAPNPRPARGVLGHMIHSDGMTPDGATTEPTGRGMAVLTAPSAMTVTELAVGFADICGFTTLSRFVDLPHLELVVQSFEDVCAGALGDRAEIVKPVGDGVLYAMPAADDAVVGSGTARGCRARVHGAAAGACRPRLRLGADAATRLLRSRREPGEPARGRGLAGRGGGVGCSARRGTGAVVVVAAPPSPGPEGRRLGRGVGAHARNPTSGGPGTRPARR